MYEAARAVGVRHGLPADWLNAAVKGFLPGADPNATTLFAGAGLTVRVASVPYLFALKVAAARMEPDAQDIMHLHRMCGFASIDEALACVEQQYPAHGASPIRVSIYRPGEAATGSRYCEHPESA